MLTGSEVREKAVVPVDGISFPTVVALDQESGHIYWGERHMGIIRRAFLNGSSETSVKGVYYPSGLAYDSVGGNLYFSDRTRHKIEVCQTSTFDRKTIVITDSPTAIVLDPENG